MAELLYGLFFLGVLALIVSCFAYLVGQRKTSSKNDESPPSSFESARMVEQGGKMQLQIMLYQPADLLVNRIPGGVGALSGFIKELEQILAEQFVDLAATSRALVVALTRSGHGFWLLSPTGPAPELPRMYALLDNIPRPRVRGPVAFAMLCNLGEDPLAKGPPTPPEWTEVVRGRGADSVQVDDIINTLLG